MKRNGIKRGKHRSVDKELKLSIAWLESLRYTERVILGLCESARHAYKPGTLRYQMDVLGGVKIKAYGGKGVIDIFVKINDENKPELLRKLKEKWQT